MPGRRATRSPARIRYVKYEWMISIGSSAASAWTELQDSATSLTSEQASEDYVSAQQTLAARPEYRTIVQLTDPTEKARRLAELDAEQAKWDAYVLERKKRPAGMPIILSRDASPNFKVCKLMIGIQS